MNLNKMIYLEILTAVWGWEEWLFMPLLDEQSKLCSPKQDFFILSCEYDLSVFTEQQLLISDICRIQNKSLKSCS